MTGFVSLVGAGPGDPGLLTRTALSRLRSVESLVLNFWAIWKNQTTAKSFAYAGIP